MSNTKQEMLDELKHSKVPADRMRWLIEMKEELVELRGLWKENCLLEKPIRWTNEKKKWWNDMFEKYEVQKPDDKFWEETQVNGIDRSKIKAVIEKRANRIKDEIERYELYPELKVEKPKVQTNLLDIKKEI